MKCDHLDECVSPKKEIACSFILNTAADLHSVCWNGTLKQQFFLGLKSASTLLNSIILWVKTIFKLYLWFYDVSLTKKSSLCSQNLIKWLIWLASSDVTQSNVIWSKASCTMLLTSLTKGVVLLQHILHWKEPGNFHAQHSEKKWKVTTSMECLLTIIIMVLLSSWRNSYYNNKSLCVDFMSPCEIVL